MFTQLFYNNRARLSIVKMETRYYENGNMPQRRGSGV
jgi:hypothetical protein